MKQAQQKKETKRNKRPGVHAKSKTSGIKNSKNYKKPYNRQGKIK
jgi:hypothetical protein